LPAIARAVKMLRGQTMETVYIETSIVSFLVAKPSRDQILAAH
jgi:hypothetical protein